ARHFPISNPAKNGCRGRVSETHGGAAVSAVNGDTNMDLQPSLLAAALLAGSAFAADLPIREVTLYKHGVGYFQRAGEVKAGETAKLDFKAGDMNDVLKSLTISASNGGKIAGVRYDASETAAKRLEDFPFALQPGATLAAFLDQMKG